MAIDEMKQLQKAAGKTSKKELNDVLIGVMKQNEIECFDTKNGSSYIRLINQKSITKKMLRNASKILSK